jgi:hypothetical protein
MTAPNIGFQFARADGGGELFNGNATAGSTTLAVQTTQVAAASRLTAGVNRVVPIAGSTAVLLPLNQPLGVPVVVQNSAATAVALLVFPAWNDTTNAASGGKVGAAAAANASFSLAQNTSAVFYPLPSTNGVATANGLAGADWAAILTA